MQPCETSPKPRPADRGQPPCRPLPPAAAAAARLVVARGGSPGRLGIVLGTGLGGLADRLDDRFSIPAHETGPASELGPEGETDYLPPSRATGHAGRVVTGRIGGVPVVVLQGRVHCYEGFGRDVVARGVELLVALGAETVVLTNASGGLSTSLVPGEIVVLEDHIDLARILPAAVAAEELPRADFARERIGRLCRSPYDPRLVEVAIEAAMAAAAPARRGVYAHLTGPSYETRAEYRFLRRIGADVVGMSTVPEAVAASLLGARVLGLSVVTNVARPDSPEKTDAEEVCRAAETAAKGVFAIISAVAATMEGHEAGSAHE